MELFSGEEGGGGVFACYIGKSLGNFMADTYGFWSVLPFKIALPVHTYCINNAYFSSFKAMQNTTAHLCQHT